MRKGAIPEEICAVVLAVCMCVVCVSRGEVWQAAMMCAVMYVPLLICAGHNKPITRADGEG